MTAAPGLPPILQRLRLFALVAAVAGLGLCALGFLLDPLQFYRSYLMAYSAWVGIAVGCIPLMLLHNLVGGDWGYPIRRPLEAGALTLPLMAVLFLPIALGARSIYPWTNPSLFLHHESMKSKQGYLKLGFFEIRAAVYFIYWIGLALLLRWSSMGREKTGQPLPGPLMTAISGPCLFLWVLSISFAATDWIMSLEPEWSSTIFGAMWMIGQGLASFAMMVAILSLTITRGNRPDAASPGQLGDLGNLMLAFVMLWTYMHLSQFLIIYAGNLKEEIPWYNARSRGGWQWVATLLFLFEFGLPFLVLLFREVKRKAQSLGPVALLIVIMQQVAAYWLVRPAFSPEKFSLHWLDLAAPVGLGGLWMTAFLWILGRAPLVPGYAPSPADVEHGEGH